MSETLRVLLVEDSEPDALLVERALAAGERACRLHVVSGRAAYLEALEQPWDLILCDHTLPDLDAPEALALATSAGSEAPFVVVSGTIDEETVVAVLREGAANFVMKGNLRRLVPVVEQALLRADERRQWLQAQSRLRLLSQALEQGDNLVVITDARGRIEYVNRRFVEVSGYSLGRLRGRTPALVKGDTAPEVHRALWTTIAAGGVWRGELDNRAEDGTAYRVAATIWPVRDDTGQITHYVGIQQDVTAEHRRRVVDEAIRVLRQSVWQLRTPEDVARLEDAVGVALRTMGVPFRMIGLNLVGSDAEDATLVVDGAATTAPGRYAEGRGRDLVRSWWRAGEVVYRRDLHVEDRHEERPQIEPVCGYPVRAVIDVPFSHGTLAVNSDIPAAFDDHIDALRQIAAVLCDAFARIDDLQRLAEQEQQLRQAQKMEALGQLAGGVAHDFNNLLTVIKGYSEFLQRRLGGAEKEELGEIGNAADRATRLVRQLLTFSRRQVMQPEDIELNRVVADMDKMLRRLVGEHIELRTQLGADVGAVHADPGQLEQVVVNLAVNARDAMPGGGTLTLSTERVRLDEACLGRHPEMPPGVYAMLAVADTGIGMDAEIQEHIFEPFFTTKGQGGGTGLGLATVFGIVKQSHGHIWVYSEPRIGTTFKVYLPLVTDVAEPVAGGDDTSRTREGHETILFVEDEDMVRRLAALALEGEGYRVLVADSGTEALELVARHEDAIDLLVTDLVMPGMNGVQLARQLREGRPGLPVVFTSGYLDQRVLGADALAADAPFLAKPYDPTNLGAKVREVLDAREAGDVTA